MGHEHPSMRARSSSHANIHVISGLGRNDLAARYPTIDQVWHTRACFPINLIVLVSQYSSHWSFEILFSAISSALLARSGLPIFMHAIVNCIQKHKLDPTPSTVTTAINMDELVPAKEVLAMILHYDMTKACMAYFTAINTTK